MAEPFDIDAARRNLAKTTREYRDRNRDLHARACRDFEAIVKMIVSKYAPVRIWQWGSLLDESGFTDHSDIDIGLEGITNAEDFFALYGDAMELTSFPLDIVQLEKIEPEFNEIIRAKGRIVYETS